MLRFEDHDPLFFAWKPGVCMYVRTYSLSFSNFIFVPLLFSPTSLLSFSLPQYSFVPRPLNPLYIKLFNFPFFVSVTAGRMHSRARRKNTQKNIGCFSGPQMNGSSSYKTSHHDGDWRWGMRTLEIVPRQIREGRMCFAFRGTRKTVCFALV